MSIQKTGLFCNLLLISMLLFSMASVYANSILQNIRLGKFQDKTRIVFDLQSPAKFNIHNSMKSKQLIIDINAINKVSVNNIKLQKIIKQIHLINKKSSRTRFIFNLREQVTINSFTLPSNNKYGHRIVIDLKVIKPAIRAKRYDPLRIVLDFGHGGKDSGSIGSKGTTEKQVVFEVGSHLTSLINSNPSLKSYLTRNNDTYVSLANRLQKARNYKANLFISLHADGFHDSKVTGASVYTLSDKGASTSTAKWLAYRENRADLVGGIRIKDKEDLVAAIILDMSKTISQKSSDKIGKMIIKELAKISTMHSNKLEHAEFMVLKSPDIPSVLVELGFISNPNTEKKLKTVNYQKKLALAIFNAIKQFFYNKMHNSSHRLQRNFAKSYNVHKGDNLAKIAKRFRVSINTLQKFNNLKSDKIYVGQILRFPN